jgi:SAM-dependent methyltransferase
LSNDERLALADAQPCLHDQTGDHPFDAHYFFQDVWAFKAIKASGAAQHVDVGSRAILVGMLTAVTHTIFVDIRPMNIILDNYTSQPASILALPFADQSVHSLSCLHVAEHIGLGRYGDALDPQGTIKACRELSRVLAPGGNLYFSLPVGRPRLCFNAHRIHASEQILAYFEDLALIEFSAVTDEGRMVGRVAPAAMENATYACGLFHFTKPVAASG